MNEELRRYNGRTRRRIFCPHCEEFVSKTTYYRHRDNYFDLQTNEWRIKGCRYARDSMEEDICSSSDDESNSTPEDSQEDEMNAESADLGGM